MKASKSRTPPGTLEPMQAAFDASVQRLPELHFTRLIAEKLRSMDVELKPIEVEALARHLLAGNTSRFELAERPGLTEVTLIFTEEDRAELLGMADRIEAGLPRMIESVTTDTAKVLLRRIRKKWPGIQAEHEQNRAAFAETIRLIWGSALDKLNMLTATADSVGGQAIAVARTSQSKERVALTAALDRLHVRGVQVAAEVLTLLREGFADAALSRWRTLHEISVVAAVLSHHGENLAIRYLDHDVVEAQRAAEAFQRCHPKEAATRRNAAELQHTKAQYDAALARYGPAFKTSYGWAAKHLDKDRPTFQHLEEAVDQARMRLRYKVASYGVHAGIKGLTTSVANVFGEGPPGGASIGGLDEAGIATAYSLVRLTESLLGPNWSIDQLAGLKALVKLRDAAAKAFMQGGRTMSEATWVSEEQVEAWQREAELDADIRGQAD